MPSVCRRIAALLAVIALSAFACVGGAVSTALAQGAGDQQYQDPFAGSDSGSSDSGGSKDKTKSDSSPEPLTPSPQTSGSSSGSSSSSGSGTAPATGTGTAATPSTSPQATGSLPNTGLDTRVVLIGGAVLLLVGLGLRLRSAPERF